MSSGYIGQVRIDQTDYRIGSTLYGVCTDISTERNRTVVIDGFVPSDGVTVHIKFINKYDNTNLAPTLTIKSNVSDSNAEAYTITNGNGATTWANNSLISFTLIPLTTGDTYEWAINSFQIDTNNIVIDASKIEGLSLGNITSNGTINNGQGNSLIITDNSASIIEGPQFGSTADGSFLDNTGNWSSIQVSSPLLITRTNASGSTIGSYTISLNTSYGDVQNPYGNKNKNLVLASSATVDGTAPTFRAIVAADLPEASITEKGIVQLSAAADDATLAATAKSVYDLSTTVNGLLVSADALVYKGLLTGASTNDDGGNHTPAANKGDVYKVLSNGYINGEYVEAGDMFICNTDNTAAATPETYSTIQSNWDIVQANLTNAVIANQGEAGYIAKFGGPNTIIKGPQITENGTGFLKQDGTWGIPTGTYELPLAASGTRGGIQLGYTASNNEKNYAVQLLNEKAYVSVPWTDTLFRSTGSTPVLNAISVKYTNANTVEESITNASATAVDLGTVENGILYIKSMYFSTTNVSTGVEVDN